jgi:hypothetical protein
VLLASGCAKAANFESIAVTHPVAEVFWLRRCCAVCLSVNRDQGAREKAEWQQKNFQLQSLALESAA